MNKKFFYLTFILIFLSGSLFAQKFTYTLTGTALNLKDGNAVYLKTLDQTKSEIIVLDSTKVKNGVFSFSETLSQPKQIRFVEIQDVANSPLLFIPEKGAIKLDIKNKSTTLSGTNENNKLQQFLTNELNLSKRGNQMAADNKGRGEFSDGYQTYLKESQSILNEIKKNRFDYISENLDSDLGEFMLLSSLELLPADTILLLLSETKESFRNSKTAKDLVDYYEPQLTKTTGTKFKDIELTGLDGKEMKLSDFAGKGKVVLLDFWASWCPPCIKEMPSLIELYKSYKDKGFEIVGVSLDDNKEAWENAVNRWSITWPQMSDLQGWKSSVVESYAVYSIPLTILIDQEGIVVGSNLHGAELREKLNQLLKK